MKKVFKFIVYTFAALFVLAVVMAIFAPDSKTNPPSSSATPVDAPAPEPLRETTARDLASAYDANTLAADSQFKGKRFRVTGVVTDINTDIMGDPVVILRGGINQFMEPQFGFSKKSAEVLSRLSKGMTVTLECRGKGDIAKTPMSDDCILVQ